MQTVVAGMFDRAAGSGAGQIGRNSPGTGERRFEVAVGDVVRADVRSATRHQVQVVDVNVARRIHVNVEPRSARGAGGGDALPLRRGIGARVDRRGRPVGHARVVLRRVDELQRRSGSVRGHGPGQRIGIGHFINHDVLGGCWAGFKQAQGFAAVFKLPRKLARQRERTPIGRGEAGAVFRNDDKTAGRDQCAGLEPEVGAVEPPVREIERRGRRGVEQLEEGGMGNGRVIHDFVDDDATLGQLSGAGERDLDRGSATANEVAVVVERLDGETVCSACQGDP